MATEEMTDLYRSHTAKTIARILDELDRTKEGYMSLDLANLNAAELLAVNTTFAGVVLPQVTTLGNTIEGLVAASYAENPEAE